MSAKQSFINFGNDMLSLLKVLISSKNGIGLPDRKSDSIVILGNGPSLRQTIDKNFSFLLDHDLMAVNFAANTPDFMRLRPQYYVLADSHFFKGYSSDSNVRRLWQNLLNASWNISLFIPAKYHHLARAFLSDKSLLKLYTFNLTPVEGSRFFSRFLYNIGAGMPRPRNVLIPAIMCAIRMDYKKIFIAGADHSWTKTLDVLDDNTVVSVQPHFYDDNEEEKKRVTDTYKDIKLHEVLGSMATAFRSYWKIADYAETKNVEIINITPESMIDAFTKRRPGESQSL